MFLLFVAMAVAAFFLVAVAVFVFTNMPVVTLVIMTMVAIFPMLVRIPIVPVIALVTISMVTILPILVRMTIAIIAVRVCFFVTVFMATPGDLPVLRVAAMLGLSLRALPKYPLSPLWRRCCNRTDDASSSGHTCPHRNATSETVLPINTCSARLLGMPTWHQSSSCMSDKEVHIVADASNVCSS
mmetsp:Transcript_68280/g.177265  ORF Transcript_68280/g.177265 Transcript_68280/m.177265 type:complete len:185 (-) Transcript_68280:231-785(-)